MPFTKPRHWLRWLLAGLAGLVVLAAAGPFVYIHFFNSTPAALSLPPGNTTSASTGESTGTGGSTSTSGSTSTGPVAGTWTVGSGSIVGYRVNEVLLGPNPTPVAPRRDAT